MNKHDILQRAIEIAMEGGYNVTQQSFDYLMNLERFSVSDYYFDKKKYYEIIFDHEFAKAFFGDKYFVCEFCGEIVISAGRSGAFKKDDLYCVNKECYLGYHECHNENIGEWEYHLQQMVLEKEPLKYLEKFMR